MKVSIVDTSPVRAGSTAVEAFRTTQELAELADRADYLRYWLSELHAVATTAGTAPEVGVAAVASRTSNLRAAPMFHIADFPAMFALPACGACQLALPRFTPAAFCEAAETHQITHKVLVPTMINLLTQFADVTA
jgi:hypothetical protein